MAKHIGEIRRRSVRGLDGDDLMERSVVAQGQKDDLRPQSAESIGVPPGTNATQGNHPDSGLTPKFCQCNKGVDCA